MYLSRPPFTLQRLTEVILEPQKSYKSTHKLINALEKVPACLSKATNDFQGSNQPDVVKQLLAVSSTVQVMDPRSAQLLHQQNDPRSTVEQDGTPPVIAVVVNDAGGLDPVARAPWSANP